jgi:hypothetical protein
MLSVVHSTAIVNSICENQVDFGDLKYLSSIAWLLTTCSKPLTLLQRARNTTCKRTPFVVELILPYVLDIRIGKIISGPLAIAKQIQTIPDGCWRSLIQ